MSKKYSGAYLGGHPKAGNVLKHIKMTSKKDGIAIINKGFMGKKYDFLVEWDGIQSIDVVSENDIKSNPSFTSALGALSGNIFLAAAGGRNVESTRTYFMVIGFCDHSGFESKIIFQLDKVHKALAHFVSERGKHMGNSENQNQTSQPVMNTGEEQKTTSAEKKTGNTKWLLLSILGWVFVPYIMVVIYVLKHQNEIFQEKNKEYVGKAAIGVAWALVMLLMVVSDGDSKNQNKDTLSKSQMIDADNTGERQKSVQSGKPLKNDLAEKEVNYKAAVDLMNEGKLEDARKVFKRLRDYKNSPEKAKEIKAILKQKDKDYKTAIKLMKDEKFEEAIVILETIPNYKDSEQLKINIDKDIAKHEELYSKALKLQEKNKLDEALASFKNVGNFKDTSERIIQITDKLNSAKYAKAKKLKARKKYKEAAEMFSELDDYKESSELLKQVNGIIDAKRNKNRLATRKFTRISADKLFDKMIWNQNSNEHWDKRYSGKYVRWNAKFVRKPLLLGKLIANSGDWGEVHCKSLDETMDADIIDKLEKWQKIRIEGRLLGFGKVAGAERAKFTLTECIVKLRK